MTNYCRFPFDSPAASGGGQSFFPWHKSMHGKRLLLLSLFQFALTAFASACLADDEAGPPEEMIPSNSKPSFRIDRLATYKDYGRVSEGAKKECGLEQSIPRAIEKFAPRYSVKASLADMESVETDDKKQVSVFIDNLVAGAVGNGFGGRWVVSEIGVVVSVISGTQELGNKYFSCSAGLGVNPFANLKACDRLDRCSEKLGAQIAKWLRLM